MFAAANIDSPNAEIEIFESGRDTLRKVVQSGGGRCNLTNAECDVAKFIKNYPRGGGSLRKPFMRFGQKQTLEWFEERGVEFVTEDDSRIFPKSENSLEIVECLEREVAKRNAVIHRSFTVENVARTLGGKYSISSKFGEMVMADVVLFAGGGRWNPNLKESLERSGHKFFEPRPSLFSFALNYGKFLELAGTSFEDVLLSAKDFGYETRGGLVITHEGLSGPAALKLSSLGARGFYDVNYKIKLTLCVVKNPQNFAQFCAAARQKESKKLVKNLRLPEVSERYWQFALKKAEIPETTDWAHFSKKNELDLAEVLTNLKLDVTGRAAHTREFVTCGGVDTADIYFKTMRSKKSDGIFFAGECINIDAFTGGFNLQAAWTTAKIAALEIENICKKDTQS